MNRGAERGRGALSSRRPRFLECSSEPFDDGWAASEQCERRATRVEFIPIRRIIFGDGASLDCSKFRRPRTQFSQPGLFDVV